MIDGQSLTALLPMKANSDRVKGKNFREIAGKPLFRWVLDALLAAPEIDNVVINTDALDVLADAGLIDGEAGGRVIIRDRKPEICGDFVSMNLVLADDIENVPSDHYLMTHTTNPLLQTATIQKMLAAYITARSEKAADSLFTVNKMHTRFYSAAGAPINHDPDNLIRTQDLDPYMEENSVCYLFSPQSFKATGARIGQKPILFPTPKVESVDIDEPADWFIADALLRRLVTGDPLPEENA